FDRAVLVEEPGGEQQTEYERQEIEPDNNSDVGVNIRMQSKCGQEQYANQKNIRALGSGHGEFELVRDTGDMQSSTIPQGIYQPIGIQLNNDRNRQYISMYQQKDISLGVEQKSGREIKVVDDRGFFNKEGGIRGGFEGLYGNKVNNRRESLGSNDSTKLARVSLVDAAKENNSEREGVGRKREGVRDGTECEEQESESFSGKDVGFKSKRGQDGA
ncbi:MAG: hypothetical protein EZS28_052334, partial [Streblomastix strix]